jgi:hypothetical protein
MATPVVLGVTNVTLPTTADSGNITIPGSPQIPSGANAALIGGTYYNGSADSFSVMGGTCFSTPTNQGGIRQRDRAGVSMSTYGRAFKVASSGGTETVRIVKSSAYGEGPTCQITWLTVDDPDDFVRDFNNLPTSSGSEILTGSVNSTTTDAVVAYFGKDINSALAAPGSTTQVGTTQGPVNSDYSMVVTHNSPGASTTTIVTPSVPYPSLAIWSLKEGSGPPPDPTPGITYVGSATGTTTATMPTHQVGDFIFVFSYRDGNTTAPTNVSGYTSLTTASGSTNSARLSMKAALSTSETVGTWTNATSTIVAVYRGLDFDNPIGGINSATGSSTNLSFPALTMAVTDGTSWVAGMVGHRSTNVAIETAPSNLYNRTTVSDATDEAAWHDSNGGLTSYSSTNAPVGGTASGYATIIVELRADTPATLTGQAVDLDSPTSGTPKVTTNKYVGTLYMVCVADGDTPSVTQIKAGQNSAGTSAIAAESISVTATGLQVFTTVTGLTTGTPYDFWFVHTTPVGNSTAYKADFTPSSGTPPSNSALFWAYP